MLSGFCLIAQSFFPIFIYFTLVIFAPYDFSIVTFGVLFLIMVRLFLSLLFLRGQVSLSVLRFVFDEALAAPALHLPILLLVLRHSHDRHEPPDHHSRYRHRNRRLLMLVTLSHNSFSF